MLISTKELKNRNIDLSVSELEEKLIQLGHEVEEVISYKNDKLVCGFIESIQKHEDAEKLNVCRVNVGGEVLQIVCGAPNVDAGQYVIVALVGCKLDDFKIKKSKIRGVESFGMICSLAEIGLESNVLTDSDCDGIYNFSSKVILGSNALESLGLADAILDLGLTANRGDCLSYDGIVRDLNALLNVENKGYNIEIPGVIDNPFVTINSDDDKTLCLTSMLVNNVKIKNVSEDIKLFLAKQGIKAQNNVVDIANYVMLTTGVPIHTYDADEIDSQIEVIELQEVEEFIALDETLYNLKPGTLVIKDKQKIVAVPSVIGSNSTKITKKTKNVLVEIGCFDATKVRLSAQNISRKTDASIRGEKGIDPVAVLRAYELLINNLQDSVPEIVNSEINFSNDLYFKQKMITLDYYDVERILGIKVTIEQVKDILARLCFELISEEEGYLKYLVPSHRFDVFNDHDLIEEIIRIYGINNVESKNLLNTFVTTCDVINNKTIKLERDLEKVVLNAGLNQVITYSLVSEDELLAFNGNLGHAIKLSMPLSNLRTYYRQSLLPSLLDCAKYNLDRQLKTVKMFEIGNRYLNQDNLVEELLISGIIGGNSDSRYDSQNRNLDFYDAKGYVESILNHYNLNYEIIQSQTAYDEINHYANADIIVNGEKVGFIGLKHINYFKKVKPDIFMFEINLSTLIDEMSREIKYNKVSINPSVTRDITINVVDETIYSEIEKVFTKIGYLNNFKLKDIYSGDSIAQGYKAYTFALEFMSNEETLTGEIVDKSVAKIIKQAQVNGMVINNV